MPQGEQEKEGVDEPQGNAVVEAEPVMDQDCQAGGPAGRNGMGKQKQGHGGALQDSPEKEAKEGDGCLDQSGGAFRNVFSRSFRFPFPMESSCPFYEKRKKNM